MIKILGLGPGSSEDLTVGSINIMKNVNNLYLRTEKHPTVDYIRECGIKFKTFDHYYDEGDSFDEVYEKIADQILSQQDVVYAVPGHPLVAEKSVSIILEKAKEMGIEVEIFPAVSFIDAIINAINIDPINGLKIIDGLELGAQKPDIGVSNIVTQVYSKLTISEAKLKLMDYYDDEQQVYLIRAAGVKQLEKIEMIPLYLLDRVDFVDHLTSIYIPPVTEKKLNDFDDLVDVVDKLRAEDGCPWDREQTHESLKRYLIEEAYEVIDAINKDDAEALCEELGDVLLQVVMHSQIAKEFGDFDITEVIDGITKKMTRRHPHVFDIESQDSSRDIIQNWEQLKREEKHIESNSNNLKLIPRVLPALIRSYKVQEKSAKIVADFESAGTTIDLIKQKLKSLEIDANNHNMCIDSEQIGELLFFTVNISRFLKIDPEFALTNAIEKFITGFEYIESASDKHDKILADLSLNDVYGQIFKTKNK